MTSAYNNNNNIGHGVRLTASDPHFVCLGGGGRLSTGVSLHNIPIGKIPMLMFLLQYFFLIINNFRKFNNWLSIFM